MSSAVRAFSPIVVLTMLSLVLPAAVSAQAALLAPQGADPGSLSTTDDGSVRVALTDVFTNGINVGGIVYDSLWIGTNGYITLGHQQTSYSPGGIPAYTQGPLIAAQFDDIHPGRGGSIRYLQDAGAGYVVVTYDEVEPFSGPGAGSGGNSFQIVLRSVGAGSQDFQIELRYSSIDWITGNSGFPTAGWTLGDGVVYSELAESGTADFFDIETGSNIGQSGVYRWDVTGGIVQSVPNVSATNVASGITATSASTGGTVLSDGGSAVTERGIAYGTSSGPTVADATVTAGTGTGSFTLDLTGLSTATTYFYRAYATNALGTDYGPERSFTTASASPATVTTAPPAIVESNSARLGGNVTADGGGAVTLRGVAYGTSSGPTIAGDTIVIGSGPGAFSRAATGLVPGTTYFARAFATNMAGTSYGPERMFRTRKLEQRIEFPEIAALDEGADRLVLAASATSRLPVTYEVADTGIARISGDTLIVLRPGTTEVTAGQPGNVTYARAESVSRQLVIVARSASRFVIRRSGGGDFGNQRVGVPFRVDIEAVDSLGRRAVSFDGRVTVTTTGDVTFAETSPEFEGGMLTGYEISLQAAGRTRLIATSSGSGVTGESDEFLVLTPEAEIRLRLDVDDSSPASGDTVTITLRATNIGEQSGRMVRVSSPLDADRRLEMIAVEADLGGFEPTTGIWDIGELASGATATLVMRALVQDLPLESSSGSAGGSTGSTPGSPVTRGGEAR
jgi:hypothetical protein